MSIRDNASPWNGLDGLCPSAVSGRRHVRAFVLHVACQTTCGASSKADGVLPVVGCLLFGRGAPW